MLLQLCFGEMADAAGGSFHDVHMHKAGQSQAALGLQSQRMGGAHWGRSQQHPSSLGARAWGFPHIS